MSTAGRYQELSSFIRSPSCFKSAKRWVGMCLVIAILCLLAIYHDQHDDGWPQSEPMMKLVDTVKPLEHHTNRLKRIDRICRERGGERSIRPVIFVTPLNRHLPFPSNSSLSNKAGQDEDDSPIITSHYHLASNFRTMGCFVNKIASSSMVSAFLKAQRFTSSLEDDPHQAHGLAHLLLPKTLEEFHLANSTYFKFMFVRHPMDRMLSGYLDKMASEPTVDFLPFYRSCIKERGQKIILNRTRNNKTNHHQSLPRCTQQKASRLAASLFHPKPNRKAIPTFEEFLEYVLSTDLQGLSGYADAYHPHWVPFHQYCSPCSINFDVIGKLETAEHDFQYIWNKSGLDKSGVIIPQINSAVPSSNPTKAELEKKYYSSLPRELIVRFYEAYRMDFELFGYSIDGILQKAGYQPLSIA